MWCGWASARNWRLMRLCSPGSPSVRSTWNTTTDALLTGPIWPTGSTQHPPSRKQLCLDQVGRQAGGCISARDFDRGYHRPGQHGGVVGAADTDRGIHQTRSVEMPELPDRQAGRPGTSGYRCREDCVSQTQSPRRLKKLGNSSDLAGRVRRLCPRPVALALPRISHMNANQAAYHAVNLRRTMRHGERPTDLRRQPA